jgi:hypothetical protein
MDTQELILNYLKTHTNSSSKEIFEGVNSVVINKHKQQTDEHNKIIIWNIAHKFQTLPKYKKLFMPVILKHFSALELYKNKLSV